MAQSNDANGGGHDPAITPPPSGTSTPPSLPDPTVDLDWGGFRGAIHDIFAANARRTPDAPCVVETPSPAFSTVQTAERSFTYRQISEASNVLARYLRAGGVTNGDVVMIWAHRGVDLVVAFMGTLATGATMTVLDPAYPPQRQKVYLEVSQPAALVRIGRATDENGPLAPLVQKYIDDELSLKAEVPSLRLGDDGVLSGGPSAGEGSADIFEAIRPLASTPPEGVLVGPDSNPTLSFTSGSEGRPKGVLGRHYSLTRYFPWMAERFNLSADSRYTLLSGLGHDPVQRDIFTPLFLGARLLVPHRDDIQHERLAEWFARHGATVTHLTPAMGQILVGGASAEFDKLEHVFFVGDVLTVRDCRALRRLAANANVINMYGTTETQRSVSYYEVPSRARDPGFLDRLARDTVPAGKGMQNVQLLVVSREDRNRVCGVGEVGEIYLRAAGLAEGYLGNDDLNAQKFLTNWFVENDKWVRTDSSSGSVDAPWRQNAELWKGPRDRLYRTGDLGRYLASGDVECTGRADDQVKIRGFRIELNDVDSNLSQSALIRDCKTLVRRDRNEEPTLVSYVVPELAEWARWLASKGQEETADDLADKGLEMGPVVVFLRRFRRMQDELRDHLKSRLPSHAVPAVFIVLNKLPLNPNGKVDKPNLPFPDVAERTEDTTEDDVKAWEALSPTERKVAEKWASLIRGLNPKTVRAQNSFFDLGGHSLLAQQVLLDVRKDLGADVPIGAFYEHPTLQGFAAQVDKRLARAANGTGAGTNGTAEQHDEADDAAEPEYARSLDALLQTALLPTYPSADPAALAASNRLTVFLTGATGFLGAYLVRDILDRAGPRGSIRLVCLVRGAKDPEHALDRLRRSLAGYGLWRGEWVGEHGAPPGPASLECVVGDLAQPRLGMDPATWQRLADTADVVVHNGATVHWVKRYADMAAANVQSTVEAMRLCAEGARPKTFTFVSSTSVLDTDHYVALSAAQTATSQSDGVLESDSLTASRRGLSTGYGQSKWVAEQLVREAGRRGLVGTVVRPGYVLGDAATGVCNVDDFLVRLLKGCIQLGARPRITNTVNAVPVGHVARVVVAAALNPLPAAASEADTGAPPQTGLDAPDGGVRVAHVTAHPRLRMGEYLSLLEHYGYAVPELPYSDWTAELERFVSAGAVERDAEQHALMPLYHFAMNDLPANTRAPELDDRNAVAVLRADADGQSWFAAGVDESCGAGVGKLEVGRFLRYLAGIGFVPPPKRGRGRSLPQPEGGPAANGAVVNVVKGVALGGRGGAVAV